MLCERCAALPIELRRHPAPNSVRTSATWQTLAALVCGRCGASRRLPDSTKLLLDTLIRLDRVGFGAEAAPLLENCGSEAATNVA